MSMSTHVVGFRAPDKKWNLMKAVWDACNEAGLVIPQEVDEFFDYEEPDPSGVTVELSYESWTSDDNTQDGIEVMMEDIPKDLTSIRFYNSY